MIGTLVVACQGPAPDPGEVPDMPAAGVPLTLAEQRARTISDLHYDISLQIPAERSAAIRGTIVARFALSSIEDPLAFDFAQPAENVLAVVIDGKPVEFEVTNEHVVIPATGLRTGRN
ncbi:MAG: hypothetical protein AAF657_37095, partial [Acidobacteriota bacterium]